MKVSKVVNCWKSRAGGEGDAIGICFALLLIGGDLDGVRAGYLFKVVLERFIGSL